MTQLSFAWDTLVNTCVRLRVNYSVSFLPLFCTAWTFSLIGSVIWKLNLVFVARHSQDSLVLSDFNAVCWNLRELSICRVSPRGPGTSNSNSFYRFQFYKVENIENGAFRFSVS